MKTLIIVLSLSAMVAGLAGCQASAGAGKNGVGVAVTPNNS